MCTITATVQVDGQIREDRENYLRVLSLAGITLFNSLLTHLYTKLKFYMVLKSEIF